MHHWRYVNSNRCMYRKSVFLALIAPDFGGRSETRSIPTFKDQLDLKPSLDRSIEISRGTFSRRIYLLNRSIRRLNPQEDYIKEFDRCYFIIG